MKILRVLWTIFLVLPLAGWGQSLIEEPFNYAPDMSTDLVTQSADIWATDGSADPIRVTAGSLSYPGMATPTGNQITLGGSSSGYYRNFAGQAAGTIYVSFLFKVSALPSAATGDYFIFLGNSTAVASPVYLRKSATEGKFNLGLGKRNKLAVSWLDRDLNVGEVYFLEFAVTYVDGDKNDLVALWLDPAPGAQPAADISIDKGSDITVFKNMNRILIAHGGDGNLGLNMQLDELRVTTEWESLAAVVLPPAPTELSATATTSKTVDLSWKDNATHETGYEIERSEDGTSFSLVKTLAAGTTAYTDGGLTASTKYYYRVRATGADGNSDYAGVVEVTTKALQSIPAAPGGLSVTDSSATAISLGWADNALNETGFQLDRSADGITFTKLTVLPAGTISYQDAGLTPETRYYYRILATGDAGNSGYSNVVEAATGSLPPGSLIEEPFNYLPSASGDLTVQSANAWPNDGSGDPVFLHPGSLTYPGFLASSGNHIQVGGASSEYYHTFSGQDIGTVYVSFLFKVTSLPGDGTGDYFIHLGNASAVAAPVYLKKSDAAGKFNIGLAKRNNLTPTWIKDDLDTGRVYFLEFAIVYVDGVKNDICDLWLDPAPGDQPTPDISISKGSDITVFKNMNRVLVHHSSAGNAGLGLELDELRVTTQWVGVRAVVLPLAPDELAATVASSTSVKLSWTDHADNETGFEIERSSDGVTFSYLASVSANVTQYTDIGLESGTRYDYRVAARGKDGNSGYSDTAAATPQLMLPAAPAGLTAVAGKTSITLKWTDESDNETGFGIERSQDGITFAAIKTVAAGTVTYEDGPLASSTTYDYRIQAVGRDGNSGYSDTATATTPAKVPDAPGNLSATGFSATGILLQWTDLSDDETGFQIGRSFDGVTFTPIDTVASDIDTFRDTTLMPTTAYYYRVIALGVQGNSGNSPTAKAITGAAIPTTPGPLTGTAVSSAVIALGWGDRSDNEKWFEVQRSGDGADFVLVGTLGPNTTSFRDSLLDPSTPYFYRVRATGIAGSSDYSNVVKVTTAPQSHDPVQVANLLTPNGDGKNDLWIIKHITEYPDNDVSVFDRSGRMVFHQAHYTNHWNGLYHENPLPSGAYYFVIRLGPGYPVVKGVFTMIGDR